MRGKTPWPALALVLAGCGSSDEVVSTSAMQSGPAGPAGAQDQACRAGDDAVCNELLGGYLKRGNEDGRRRAANLTRALCEDDRAQFCTAYAMALAAGAGVPQDRDRARALFEKHCAADPKGCSEYGNLFAAGQGVEQDLGLAWLLLGEACDHEDAQACEELRPLLEHACKGGVAGTCNDLAVRSAKEGAPIGDVLGLFERACDLGDPHGCENAEKARNADENAP